MNHIATEFKSHLQKFTYYPKPIAVYDLNDRFLLLQHSHNLLTYTKDTTGYYNYNHTITYYNNGVKDQAISLKTYNQRLKNSISMDISFGSVNDLWKRNSLVNKDIKI